MNTCEWCNLSDNDKKYQLIKTEYWTVFLADKQDYIGRCVLVCNRHAGSLSDLSDKEWSDLKILVNKLESCLSNAFGAAPFNWSCLMNDFYKADAPNPHLHIHLRPRCKKPVRINGKLFFDAEYSHHYDNKKILAADTEDIESIYLIIKNRIENESSNDC